MLRPITARLLATAGIEPGMRVLDIGCGPGDVSMLIAEFVGPTGNVGGIDPTEQRSMSPGSASMKQTAPTSSSFNAVSTSMPAKRVSMRRYADTS
ncbi:methyltransferase domain-containing protein [Mycobacterium sp. NPDC048908]|uniref:methyltransferase domain-containing protein n=1 Tax=Mycobacterium sp. NPDC048908 TaxID=3364292 RepID=UPI003721404E